MVLIPTRRGLSALDASNFSPGTHITLDHNPQHDTVIVDEIIPAFEGWSYKIRAGNQLRIIDIGGNQSADFLVYNAADTSERYSAQATIAAQNNIYLGTGSVLYSQLSQPLMTVLHSDVARQDTIGGACSKESNTLRYGYHTYYQHACRENFLIQAQKWNLDRRDLVSNINWSMNVPVMPDGSLGIVDGQAPPGSTVILRADRDCLVIISNCPQINNPCNDFNPTPLQVVISAPHKHLPAAQTYQIVTQTHITRKT